MPELKPRRARANAFDLSRTDRDDVDYTPPAPPLAALLPKISTTTKPAGDAPAQTAANPSTATPSTGAAGTWAPAIRGPGSRTTRQHRTSHPAPAVTSGSGAPSDQEQQGERGSGFTDSVAPLEAPTTDPTTLAGAVDPETDPALSEKPRGVGGRPAGNRTSRITATAARVPVALYDRTEDLVKGRGKPSWGQLIAWTCKTREQEIVDHVLQQLRPPEGLVPRGQNKRGTASTQVTARFTPNEDAVFTSVRDKAIEAAEASTEPLDGPVTATLVVIAALEVASTHEPADAEEDRQDAETEQTA